MTSFSFQEVVERSEIVRDATFRVVRYDCPVPSDEQWISHDHGLLDISLSRRSVNTMACYEENWGRNRFERLGDVAFYPPGVPIRARGEPGQERVLHGYLPGADLSATDWSETQLKESLDLKAPFIRQTCKRILMELYNPGFAGALIIESLAQLLSVDLIGHFATLPMPRRERGGLAPWQMRRIEERTQSEDPLPSLDELAGLCRLGRRQLMRAFKQSQRETIGEYVDRIRLERAMILLGGRQQIAEIAHALGFASASSFSATFKRATGRQPSAFRKSCARDPLPWRPI